jgi:uncharacterized short protein YbdD (DUF466 family)
MQRETDRRRDVARPTRNPARRPISEAWRRYWRALPGVLRRIAGVPDYTAYLEHCHRAGHPPRLDERAFIASQLAARERGGRCC